MPSFAPADRFPAFHVKHHRIGCRTGQGDPIRLWARKLGRYRRKRQAMSQIQIRSFPEPLPVLFRPTCYRSRVPVDPSIGFDRQRVNGVGDGPRDAEATNRAASSTGVCPSTTWLGLDHGQPGAIVHDHTITRRHPCLELWLL